MNIEEIKAELKSLIEKRKTIDENTSEANIEATLISQLFTVLGWNFLDPSVYDRNSYVRGAGYPDVALKIDNKAVIFVEVKKIGKIPKNRIDPQAQMTLPLKELAELIDRTPEEKQAFKYARGQEIDWAILTNFDCLFVYNANQEHLVLSFKTPEEYLQRFDELLWLSREKVKGGSLEWAQSQLKKEEIDRSFLEKLKNWRVTLARNIYDENGDNHILKDDKGEFDLEKLMRIVQRVLSRLLIIQIADDREVLKQHNLLASIRETYENMGAYVTEDHLSKKFMELSEMMDKLHNTSIFTPGHPCDKVFISNWVLDKVIKELCNVSFRKMTADILGATYESYLGYRFSLKNGKIEAEVDQRVRKQAGIYYTPSYIVRYIVDNTLGVKLKELEDQYGLEAGEKAKDLKILDPACGSGSFLIYAFDVLANFYERLNAKITEKQVELSKINSNSDMFERQEQFKRLPSRVADYPKRILEDHLYGVDLDPAACEIATINLVIKAFEKMRDKKLPLILNQNVKVGNSLVSGIQKKEDLGKFKDEITEHIERRRRLKEAEDDEEKRELMKKIDQLRQKVNSQLNESLKKYFDQPEDKRPFNWEFEFPEVFDSEKPEEQKGFDVVMGNPPYKDIKELNPQIVDFMFSSYVTTSNRMNVYSTFVHRGHQLLKQNGNFGHIIPNSILTQSSYQKIRDLILNNSQLISIVRLPNKTFPEATVETIILIFRKKEHSEKIKEDTDILIFSPNDVINSIDSSQCKQHHTISQKTWQKSASKTINIYTPGSRISLLEKIEDSNPRLSELAEFCLGLTPYDIYKGHTKKQIKEKIFHASYKKDNTYRKLLSGEDIRRYSLNWNEKEWISYGDWLGAPRGKKFFTKKRILIRQIISGDLLRIYATYTNEEYYNTQIAFNLIPKSSINELYLLGVINSLLISYYHRTRYLDSSKETFQKILIQDAKEFPIRVLNLSEPIEKVRHNELVKYVDLMLERNKQKNELLKIFERVLKNHSHEVQPFSKAYYEKPEYIEKIDKKATEVANLTDEVSKIFLEDERKTLVFSVLLKGERQVALRLKIADEDFRLFLFYSVRKYLEENKRRKKWTTKSLPKVLDVILGRLEVPVFKSSGKIHDPRYNLRMINLIMKEFKTKFHKQFPKGNLHLSQIEKEIQDTDNSIDALVFKLYDLNKEEVTTVLDSMETPEIIKEDILKKFEAME